MRILLLAQWYPPIIGGEEGHVEALARTLSTRGHRVSVATLWHPGLPRRETVDGVTIHRLQGTVQRVTGLFADPDRRSAPPFPDPETTLGLARILRAERPDVVHAHNWLMHSWLPMRPIGGHVLVVTLHDYGLVCAKKNLIRKDALCEGPSLGRCLPCAGAHYGSAKGTLTVLATAAARPVVRRAVDMIVPVSDAVRRGVGLAADDPRVRVIPNFVQDPPPVDDEAAALMAGLPTRRFWLYVGALSRQKGIATLLAAHARLATGDPLVLIGYPASDMPPEISQPPADVVVRFSWPRQAVLAAMERSLAVVVPSTWREPCPTVVLEAMTAGRPIVGSRIGGIPELVDDESAILVDPGDADALADAMQRLADDPHLAASLGAAARARAAAYRVDAVVPRIEAVYRELLNARGATA